MTIFGKSQSQWKSRLSEMLMVSEGFTELLQEVFSAGHFNTVNTPQGWYPKQFKSSRENKSDKTSQKPEDCMDDEDVGAFGFAAQALKTKSRFQGGAEPSAPVHKTD